MKKISEHLGEIIVALAGIALLIAAITLFKAPIGGFFNNIIDNELEVGNKVLDQIYIPPKYTIIKGGGQTYSTGLLSFTSDAPFSKFAGVKVNDELVDPVNYTVEEGSTIITFTEEYSKVLANGDYTIEVLATDGAASAPFDVEIGGGSGTNTPVAGKLVGTWETKTWNGLTNFMGNYVWEAGGNTYYSQGSKQYVLNGDTWETKTWTGLTSFNGNMVWTDGTNIYYSYDDEQYVLNGDTWETKTWNGLTSFDGSMVWTDGTDIYFGQYSYKQYVLNGDTWETKTWSNGNTVTGNQIWNDGTNLYQTKSGANYVYNFETKLWEEKTWNGINTTAGSQIWSYKGHYFYCEEAFLNGDTWEEMTWNGLSTIFGYCVWTDGTNTYYSYNGENYVLVEVHYE